MLTLSMSAWEAYEPCSKTWQLFLLILAGWINRHQQEVIEYLKAENRVLREKFGKRRSPV